MSAPIRATAFIDWNSQLTAVDGEEQLSLTDRAREALRYVGKRISKALSAVAPNERFRLDVRMYCGWTKGFTRSDYYKALSGLTEVFDVDAQFPSGKINVSAELGYGDRLLDGLPMRENTGLGIHLPNTLRDQDGSGRRREKMVDTALTCDLLSWIRSDPSSWSVVVSDDDDHVPSVFVAEAWLQQSTGRVLLIRSNERPSERFLKLEGLIWR